MWAGTQFSGLNRLDRTTGQFTRFLNNPDDPYSLSNNRVYGPSRRTIMAGYGLGPWTAWICSIEHRAASTLITLTRAIRTA